MRHPVSHPELAAPLRRILSLLEQLQPTREDSDVLWLGPHFIPRRGEWWPTRFLRYRDELYCWADTGWSTLSLVCHVNTAEVSFEGDAFSSSNYRNGPEIWDEVLKQVDRRLQAAIGNLPAYNRRVARLLPLACRTGRIQRKLTWPKSSRPPMSQRDLTRLERALEQGKSTRSRRALNVRHYLEVAALAYDSVFKELKKLTPREKYKRKADTRHGGMLDLAPSDSSAFERWYTSSEWQGTHPWEIVFAHPHGVLLSPHREENTWRFYLGVDTLGLYVATARMAIALGEGGVPFELSRAPEVIAAIRGEDWVEIGPFYDQLCLEELEHRRTGATAHVEWEAPPHLAFREPAGEQLSAKGQPDRARSPSE